MPRNRPCPWVPAIGRWVIVSAGALLACTGEAPVEPGLGDYRLPFVGPAASGDLQQIYAMDLDGSHVETVLLETGVYEELRASPDGRQVLFLKTAGAEPLGTHVLDVDDAALRVLPEVGPGYTWSPDGGRIASRLLVPGGRNPDGTQRPPTHRAHHRQGRHRAGDFPR